MPKVPKIRFLADENINLKVIRSLIKAGWDIRIAPKGLKNGELFKSAIHEKRALLTHDNDFSDQARYPASKTVGVLIIKIHPPREINVREALENFAGSSSSKKIEGSLVFLLDKGFLIA